MLYVKAPAKINLTLDVLYKRPDNFHEVEMVMTTVDLADRISLESREDGVIQIISTDNFVPNDHRNFAYQAARLIKDTYGIRQGVSITIEKEIPIAAGLAGGSSDAAATLKGLNELWDLGLSIDELAELGAKIGSDVSFCVYGGTALATGRGEKIKELPAPPNCWVVLAKPKIGVSTAEVYGGLKVEGLQHPNTQQMIQAIEKKDYELLCSSLGNVLETVTFKLHPEVVMLKEQMKRFGADATLMSGSGPTVFGLVDSEARVSRIYNGLRGFCEEVYAVRILGERNTLA
ncbi:4-(cytidine 5'-diphospho)-2-C-methyl-D-erythritol kinase [Lysinibacillus capsici]|jgi:4-diphosphocytidyl-2-C-methyl-D-erythritol kinase|uniref:4-(cytidine 5'-diphospho)-2-C-methyl-D-erythritol kinase n=1 Tax=Lysinibacillus TaxID=400634 RepID=UPI00103A2D29|nr:MULTISPECIES: 4-(cytidine 5'-diphospho)-2-C-methyl-D-erythritol kinase [unclassified Lysinibacillus]MCM0627089.1 4-(cytidine 5'-diphospho)-2-C-methyl-D-erythritol kinase [Lysinibacillus sp. OL1_EC]TBV84937.1 4-(cytidine 5'-diphospho)-2-C-methyl-D-erythritol kinase [Lysinibacillus sp. OL1]UKJ45549.1 4-(cytidine 5'-diphospho)-2-C-methyl-D-erythritol kinase [Lysinibacillus sp. ACHW1.5]WGT37810.1 4-(cytidine 5'-diphospho)-2-C-methyl-D-erythritol kinase [Lysinibacillus sp. 1 U-2021]